MTNLLQSIFSKGVRFMIMSTFVFAIMNAIAKSLEDYSWSEIVFYRSITSLVICISLIYYQGIAILGNQRKLLLARGIIGTCAMCTFFAALKLLPLATTVSLRYLSPIFGAILAMIFLKDRIKPVQWLFFLLAFGGVLIVKGFDSRISAIGLIIVICSALFTGAVYVLIQSIGQRDHPLVVVFYFMFFSTITGVLFSVNHWSIPQRIDWFYLLSLGVLGYIGQLYMTKALQEESTGTVAPFKYTEAIFVFIIGWIWLGETYTLIPLVGLAMIITGMLLNVIAARK